MHFCISTGVTEVTFPNTLLCSRWGSVTPDLLPDPALQLYVSEPSCPESVPSRPIIPIHSHTSTIGSLNIQEHLSSPGLGDRVDGFTGWSRFPRVDEADLQNALKMSGWGELWSERFCFQITWVGEAWWRDKRERSTKVWSPEWECIVWNTTLDAAGLHMARVCVRVLVFAKLWVPKSAFYQQTGDIFAGPRNFKGLFGR